MGYIAAHLAKRRARDRTPFCSSPKQAGEAMNGPQHSSYRTKVSAFQPKPLELSRSKTGPNTLREWDSSQGPSDWTPKEWTRPVLDQSSSQKQSSQRVKHDTAQADETMPREPMSEKQDGKTGNVLHASQIKVPVRRKMPNPTDCKRNFPHLTLAMLLNRQPAIFDGQKLAAVEKFVTDITLLPNAFQEAQIIYLSKNLLTSLESISQFNRLRTLSLADNLLANFQCLRPLQELPCLQSLSLEGNPLARLPNYRAQVLAMLPSLKTLDGVTVSKEERSGVAAAIHYEAIILEVMLTNECLLLKLEHSIRLIQVHTELLAVTNSQADWHGRSMKSPALGASKLMILWDFQAMLNPKERNHLIQQLRWDVVFIHEHWKSKKPRRPASWQDSFAKAMLHQQERIVHFIGVFEEIKALSERNWSLMRKTRIEDCREQMVDQSTSATLAHLWERESLILEMRDNLCAMTAHAGDLSNERANLYKAQLSQLQNQLGTASCLSEDKDLEAHILQDDRVSEIPLQPKQHPWQSLSSSQKGQRDAFNAAESHSCYLPPGKSSDFRQAQACHSHNNSMQEADWSAVPITSEPKKLEEEEEDDGSRMQSCEATVSGAELEEACQVTAQSGELSQPLSDSMLEILAGGGAASRRGSRAPSSRYVTCEKDLPQPEGSDPASASNMEGSEQVLKTATSQLDSNCDCSRQHSTLQYLANEETVLCEEFELFNGHVKQSDEDLRPNPDRRSSMSWSGPDQTLQDQHMQTSQKEGSPVDTSKDASAQTETEEGCGKPRRTPLAQQIAEKNSNSKEARPSFPASLQGTRETVYTTALRSHRQSLSQLKERNGLSRQDSSRRNSVPVQSRPVSMRRSSSTKIPLPGSLQTSVGGTQARRASVASNNASNPVSRNASRTSSMTERQKCGPSSSPASQRSSMTASQIQKQVPSGNKKPQTDIDLCHKTESAHGNEEASPDGSQVANDDFRRVPVSADRKCSRGSFYQTRDIQIAEVKQNTDCEPVSKAQRKPTSCSVSRGVQDHSSSPKCHYLGLNDPNSSETEQASPALTEIAGRLNSLRRSVCSAKSQMSACNKHLAAPLAEPARDNDRLETGSQSFKDESRTGSQSFAEIGQRKHAQPNLQNVSQVSENVSSAPIGVAVKLLKTRRATTGSILIQKLARPPRASLQTIPELICSHEDIDDKKMHLCPMCDEWTDTEGLKIGDSCELPEPQSKPEPGGALSLDEESSLEITASKELQDLRAQLLRADQAEELCERNLLRRGLANLASAVKDQIKLKARYAAFCERQHLCLLQISFKAWQAHLHTCRLHQAAIEYHQRCCQRRAWASYKWYSDSRKYKAEIKVYAEEVFQESRLRFWRQYSGIDQAAPFEPQSSCLSHLTNQSVGLEDFLGERAPRSSNYRNRTREDHVPVFRDAVQSTVLNAAFKIWKDTVLVPTQAGVVKINRMTQWRISRVLQRWRAHCRLKILQRLQKRSARFALRGKRRLIAGKCLTAWQSECISNGLNSKLCGIAAIQRLHSIAAAWRISAKESQLSASFHQVESLENTLAGAITESSEKEDQLKVLRMEVANAVAQLQATQQDLEVARSLEQDLRLEMEQLQQTCQARTHTQQQVEDLQHELSRRQANEHSRCLQYELKLKCCQDLLQSQRQEILTSLATLRDFAQRLDFDMSDTLVESSSLHDALQAVCKRLQERLGNSQSREGKHIVESWTGTPGGIAGSTSPCSNAQASDSLIPDSAADARHPQGQAEDPACRAIQREKTLLNSIHGPSPERAWDALACACTQSQEGTQSLSAPESSEGSLETRGGKSVAGDRVDEDAATSRGDVSLSLSMSGTMTPKSYCESSGTGHTGKSGSIQLQESASQSTSPSRQPLQPFRSRALGLGNPQPTPSSCKGLSKTQAGKDAQARESLSTQNSPDVAPQLATIEDLEQGPSSSSSSTATIPDSRRKLKRIVQTDGCDESHKSKQPIIQSKSPQSSSRLECNWLPSKLICKSKLTVHPVSSEQNLNTMFGTQQSPSGLGSEGTEGSAAQLNASQSRKVMKQLSFIADHELTALLKAVNRGTLSAKEAQRALLAAVEKDHTFLNRLLPA